MSSVPAQKLFFDRPALSGMARAKNLRDAVQAHPDRLHSVRHAKRVLQRITMPASGAWAYGSNPKAATTTTYNALFELTFGCRLSAALDEGVAEWADQSPQNLGKGQIFYQLAEFENCLEAMDKAFRFSVVRNPFERAVSSFHFICFTQEKAFRHFYADRLRMNVMGFDWDADPYTTKGFIKFLDYAEQEASMDRKEGRLADPHFRPQWMNMSLDILNPHLVFKVDELSDGLDVLAHQLGRPPLARATTTARLNAQPERPEYPGTRAQVERVFAKDYEIYEDAGLHLRKNWAIPGHAS